jgi:hypothetical protein
MFAGQAQKILAGSSPVSAIRVTTSRSRPAISSTTPGLAGAGAMEGRVP